MGDRIGVQLLVREIYLSLTSHPGQLSLAIPLWVGTMSTGQRAVMLCDWGDRVTSYLQLLALCLSVLTRRQTELRHATLTYIVMFRAKN